MTKHKLILMAGCLLIFLAVGGKVLAQGPPAGPISDHAAEMATQHSNIQTDISAAQTAIQTDISTHAAEMATQHSNIQTDISDAQTAIAEVKALVEALGTPCGAGTAGQRFVPDDPTTPTEYCDNTTGLWWEASPSTSKFTWLPDGGVTTPAIDHCANLDLGNGQIYRLPEIKELISLVDYSQAFPSLPVGHPFIDVQSFFYWSATPDDVSVPTFTFAWYLRFDRGVVAGEPKTSPMFVWCAR